MDTENTLAAAFAAYEAGDLHRTETLCIELLTRDPENFEGLLLAGRLAETLERPWLGVDLVRDAVALKPASAEAHIQLGKLLRQQWDLDGAAESFEAAIRLAPNEIAAYRALAATRILQNRPAEGARVCESGLAFAPDSDDLWYYLGSARMSQKRWADAASAYKRAFALAPGRLDVCYELAKAHFECGAFTEAAALCRSVLTLKPDDLPALQGL